MAYEAERLIPNTGGGFYYQRIAGNGFIPGVVPAYTNVLPQVTNIPFGSTTNDTYIYTSNTAGTGFVLQRLLQPNIPAEEWANVPANQKQGTYLDRYGYGNGMGATQLTSAS